MKVLFLDIDGVLNSERTRMALGGYPQDFAPAELEKFDWVAVLLIKRLCRETGAVVVMSSAWRNLFELKDFKENFDLPVIDRTPYLGSDAYAAGVCRGDEIAAWLKDHPEVTHYAIVDDYADMLEEQQEFFVLTTEQDGLRYNDYMMLRNLLELLPAETVLGEKKEAA
jgi:hypothetical protein